jgi:hypothetical protein
MIGLTQRLPKVDDAVHYYAEGAPYSGPFDARVVAVTEGGLFDLMVTFPTTKKLKSRVPFTDSPTKHACAWPPR